MDNKIVILSQYPLPYHKIGSWTTMYDHYILKNKSQITTIICPKLESNPYSHIEYLIYKKPLLHQLKSKLTRDRYFHIIDNLNKFLNKNSERKFIIQIIDNYGLLRSLCKFIIEKKLRSRIYLQYFYHGYRFNYDLKEIHLVMSTIDELILLTNLSLKAIKNQHDNLPMKISVLQNGIDTSIFNSVNRKTKTKKTVFLWCSQDRPKKGLHIILKIWDNFYAKFPNTELWIVGTYNKIEGPGITSFGRIENHKLPEIYKNADAYLFPVQWEEPFGLTLIEALHCGCFCIASKLGGIPEVLNFGQYGWLIDNPHKQENWLIAMERYLSEKPKHFSIPKELYSLENWCENMNGIIFNAKQDV